MKPDLLHYTQEFDLVVDGSRAITPCMSFTLHLDGTHRDGVLNFYERTRNVLSDFLNYYVTDSMKYRARMNLKSENLIPGLMQKLSESKIHYIAFSGCGEKDGISDVGIEFSIVGWAPPNEEILTRRRSNWRSFHERGADLFLPMTKLRVTLSLNHPLSRDPDDLLEWISGFLLVREGGFLFGTCGLGVNYDEYTASSIIRPAMMQKLAHICTEYHGTEWNLPCEFDRRLFRWDSDLDDVVPQIPRVSWLTLLGPQCMKFLNKYNFLIDSRFHNSSVRQYLIGTSSIIRADSEPTYGGKFDSDTPASYRHVAEVLKPLLMRDISPPNTPDYSWIRKWRYFL